MSESKQQYWIDSDGYLVCGDRETNKWETVVEAEVLQEHVEPLSLILHSHDALLEACKLSLALQYPIDENGESELELGPQDTKLLGMLRAAIELAEKEE